MTREHKLALIVGFSLVLILGVLISDHFSKARSQSLASEITPGTAERFGADTRNMRVVSASAPGPTILTPPAGAELAPSLLPPSGEPIAPPTPANSGGVRLLTMGEPDAPSGGVLGNVIGSGPALASSAQTALSPAETPSGVRQLDPATGAAIPPSGSFGASPVGTPVAGTPGMAPPSAAPARIEPAAAKEELVNGVPLSMMKRHDVREGESAYRIAQEAYGDGKLWSKLADYNKGKMGPGGNLRQGVTVLLPPKEALLGKPLPAPEAAPTPAKTTPPAKVDPRAEIKTAAKADKPDAKAAKAAAKTYTVQKGDSLSDIARKTLGSSKRWNEIVELNKDVLDDEDTLVVGKTLKIPAR